jgi:hypothetical protein
LYSGFLYIMYHDIPTHILIHVYLLLTFSEQGGEECDADHEDHVERIDAGCMCEGLRLLRHIEFNYKEYYFNSLFIRM